MIEESISAFDRNRLVQYKNQLMQQVEKKEIVVHNFDTRFIFDVYYSCVPLATRMQLHNEADYKDIHIETAVRTVLKKLNIL